LHYLSLLNSSACNNYISVSKLKPTIFEIIKRRLDIMPNFYSPTGNYEVHDTKPEGYFTKEEWDELHPYVDPRTLEELKDDKHLELKAIRDSKEVEPITVDGKMFDFDQKASERINFAITALELSGESITWTLADNTSTTVTANDLKAVVAAVAIRSNELHNTYRTLMGQLSNCGSKEQVNSIQWPEEE
jgi:hypothetical protein